MKLNGKNPLTPKNIVTVDASKAFPIIVVVLYILNKNLPNINKPTNPDDISIDCIVLTHNGIELVILKYFVFGVIFSNVSKEPMPFPNILKKKGDSSKGIYPLITLRYEEYPCTPTSAFPLISTKRYSVSFINESASLYIASKDTHVIAVIEINL